MAELPERRARPDRRACVVIGALLPFTPIALWLGFTPLPPLFLAVPALMVAAYLGLVEAIKGRLYGRYSL